SLVLTICPPANAMSQQGEVYATSVVVATLPYLNSVHHQPSRLFTLAATSIRGVLLLRELESLPNRKPVPLKVRHTVVAHYTRPQSRSFSLTASFFFRYPFLHLLRSCDIP